MRATLDIAAVKVLAAERHAAIGTGVADHRASLPGGGLLARTAVTVHFRKAFDLNHCGRRRYNCPQRSLAGRERQ
jgi:hypothetical protein